MVYSICIEASFIDVGPPMWLRANDSHSVRPRRHALPCVAAVSTRFFILIGDRCRRGRTKAVESREFRRSERRVDPCLYIHLNLIKYLPGIIFFFFFFLSFQEADPIGKTTHAKSIHPSIQTGSKLYRAFVWRIFLPKKFGTLRILSS